MLDAALEGAWQRGWAERPSLDPEALIRKAAGRAAPLDDPDNGWRTRLDVLCHDLETVAHLTPLGRTIAHGQLVAALRNRRRLHALWQRHPEIADQPIRAPIIIVGQMRSGTTRIQRLLACDPRLAFTRFFESWNPLPHRPRRAWLDDRKIRGQLATMSVRLLNPAFDAIHPTHWNAADEEIGLQSVSIFGSAFEAQWRVPTYTARVEADDGIMAYAEFRRLLQTLAWLRRDDGSRPWILKVPQFSQDLPALLHTFPDARLVCLSRDRQAVISSSASLVRNQMTVQSARVDPTWIGREWTRKVALRTQRITEAVTRSEAPRVEVTYRAVDHDWRREIHRIYEMIDMSLPATVLARMSDYMSASRSDRHAQHRYPTIAMEHRLPSPGEPSGPVLAIQAAA